MLPRAFIELQFIYFALRLSRIRSTCCFETEWYCASAFNPSIMKATKNRCPETDAWRTD